MTLAEALAGAAELTIRKYPLPIQDEIPIRMPKGARLLSVQTQRDAACLWAMVDPQAPETTRRLALRGTGHDVDGLALAPFVGTFQLDGGAFVGHVFDLGEAP